ncbi:hypothetical protein BH18ACT2_BH18ACT2_15320 [soil metagenome]
MFALGLIYAEYLTGRPPPFDVARYHEPAVAVRNGQILRITAADDPPTIVELVNRMLLADPAARPAVAEIHARLMAIRPGSACDRSVGAVAPARPSSTLKGKGLRTARTDAGGAGTSSATGAARQLLGKLLDRFERDRTP